MKKLLIPIALMLSASAGAVEVSVESDSSLPVVYVNVAVKAGTVTDPEGQSGMTNFMGEMLMRGTKLRTKEQIDLEIDQLGARLGVETRLESMIVRGAVLKSQLQPFLKLVTELLTQPSFPEEEVRKLKSEVISQLLEEQGSDGELSSRKFAPFLFQGHPYGKPILGKIHDIEKLTQAQVQAHYDRLVRDRELLVVATGDTTKSEIQNWADHLAGLRPGGESPVHVKAPQNAPTRRLQLVDKPDRTQTQIEIGQIGIRMTDSDYFPLYLGNHAFGGGSFLSRLMVEIRVKRGWSYGAGSRFRYGLEPRSWQTHLFPAAKDTAAALETTLKLIQNAQQSGISAEEFQVAQQSLINSSGFMYDTPKKRVENKLLERTMDLPDGFMKSYGPELTQVTLEQVNESLKKFLKPEQLAISVLCTAKDLKGPLAKSAGVQEKDVLIVPYNID